MFNLAPWSPRLSMGFSKNSTFIFFTHAVSGTTISKSATKINYVLFISDFLELHVVTTTMNSRAKTSLKDAKEQIQMNGPSIVPATLLLDRYVTNIPLDLLHYCDLVTLRNLEKQALENSLTNLKPEQAVNQSNIAYRPALEQC